MFVLILQDVNSDIPDSWEYIQDLKALFANAFKYLSHIKK